jgi:predicted ATPase
LAKQGQAKDGITQIRAGLAISRASRDQVFRPCHLLLGTEAKACFHNSLTIARQQSATAWKLRAVTSLIRLWQQQGKKKEARTLLAKIYGWFAEGFDTADLQEAQRLLNTWAKKRSQQHH